MLDPAQNHSFRDHYLELDLDLSDVLFIATANVLDTIPAPLLDRMELIQLDGYTDDEKVAIARDHLLARQLALAGLHDDEVTVTDDALHRVVEDYTREAGVRGLERRSASWPARSAARVAQGDATPIVVDGDDVTTYLGRARFRPEARSTPAAPASCQGLAVTGAGGDVLSVEATAFASTAATERPQGPPGACSSPGSWARSCRSRRRSP